MRSSKTSMSIVLVLAGVVPGCQALRSDRAQSHARQVAQANPASGVEYPEPNGAAPVAADPEAIVLEPPSLEGKQGALDMPELPRREAPAGAKEASVEREPWADWSDTEAPAILPVAYRAEEPHPLPEIEGVQAVEASEPPINSSEAAAPSRPVRPPTWEGVLADDELNIDMGDGTEWVGHVTITPSEKGEKSAEHQTDKPYEPMPAPLPELMDENKSAPGSIPAPATPPTPPAPPPPPAELKTNDAVKDLARETLVPVPAGTATAPPVTNMHVAQKPAAVRIMGVYGVNEDRPGIADNISTRIGATYYQVDDDSAAGVVGILEGSEQFWSSPFFLHGGVAGEYIKEEWPVAFSIGISRLATIEGGRVTRPWIFSVAYDGYFDSTFFQTNDDVYLDQVRGLVGYAIKPWIDIGVWGAKGMRSDFGIRNQNGALFNVTGRFADRVAGYAAFDTRWNALFICSAGWEDGPGTAFTETDVWIPLTRACNLFGGVGYSNSGALDAICGLEFKFGQGRHHWWKHKSGHDGDAYARASSCDPCGVACDPCACDPCAKRYRGGWANHPYRGALRVVTPSRMRRMLDDPNPRIIGGVIPPGAVVAPPGGNTTPPGGVNVDPQKPNCGCGNDKDYPSRRQYLPERDSRLAQWLRDHNQPVP